MLHPLVRFRALVLLPLLAVLHLVGCAQPAGVLFGPYVTGTSQTDARILWVTEPYFPAGSVALLGDVKSARIQTTTRPVAEGAGLVHIAQVTGLAPATTYRYALTDPAGTTTGSFQTAPPPGSTAPLRFIVYGDSRSDVQAHAAVIHAMQADFPVAFVIHSGDLVGNGEIWPQWKDQLFDPAAPLLRRTTFWPVRGNHELDAVIHRELFAPDETRAYYSFDCGDLHVIALDTGVEDGETPDPDMVAWLEKDLAATHAPWKLVTLHAPIFNIGGHMSRWGQKEVLPLLEKYGVDVVIAGHSHLYERFVPIGPAGQKPIIHIVSAGGGAPLYASRPSPILEFTRSVYHYCLFELQGDRLMMTAKTPDGQILDHFTLLKKDGKYQPEIMQRAWDTQEAIDASFLLTGLTADAPTLQPGTPTTLNLRSWPFPKDTQVKITPAPDCPWTVVPTEFTVGDTPLTLQVTPPAGIKFAARNFTPALKVALAVTFHGKTWTHPAVPVSWNADTIRRFTPDLAPVDIPAAPAALTLGGNLTAWQNIPPVPIGPTHAPSPFVRLAWRPEGLYGAVRVPATAIHADPRHPWTADCLEVCVETDHARALNTRTPNAFKFELFPDPRQAGGPMGVHGTYGRTKDNPNLIQSAWQHTADGYTCEFLIPAAALAPAQMEPGAVLGFHYSLDAAGRPLEVFTPARDRLNIPYLPLYWRPIRLAPAKSRSE